MALPRPTFRFAPHRLTRLVGLALLLLCAVTSLRAEDAWWDKAWTARKKITVDTTAGGGGVTEPIGGATVLLRLFDEQNYPKLAKPDLSDLRFVTEDNKTVLPYHVERVDATMLQAFVWVKLPDVKPNAKTTFWLYYGSTDPKATKAEDPKASYDGDAAAVFHFGESGAPAADSTKNGNVAETPGGRADDSCIASALSFTGKNPVTIKASPSLTWAAATPVTISAWVRVNSIVGTTVILSRREGAQSLVVGVEKGVPYLEISGQRAKGSAPLAIASSVHLAVIAQADKTTLYVNGEQVAFLAVPLPALNSPLYLGGEAPGGAPGFNGELDELQIHNVARPLGFVQLAAFGEDGEKAAKTIQIGLEEKPAGMFDFLTTGHFAVIVKNLTPDGWAVIVLLAIMLVVSWYVMFSKVRYLNGITKGNVLFMDQWRYVAADLTVLDDDDVEKSKTLGGRVTKENARQLRKSSVYRIYHIGVEEIRQRLATDRAEGVRRGLAGRSIQAVRASLDGGLVRESQKLSKSIVLLTICISGGPFLGLLGTVVGVMITFAAVAEAGEVNVNAIAPGIAAALLATVAGLAVAIPALFGYNYILSRVKDAKDDMHVFIDEFVTRMAEFHREKGERIRD
jgi:biopolymer transport protein ExbB